MAAGPSWNDDELSGLGFTTDAAATGDGSLIAITKQIRGTVATAAKQPALGTAGTPSADVISVQGVASGTAQPVSGTLTGVTTVTTVNTVTNLAQLAGVAISMNTGVRDTGTQRVTIATNDVVPASQSGTWTVQPGNTANTTAWKVDGSAVTQPVSGTFWQATQPVSGTFWQATQPVSSTTLATEATLAKLALTQESTTSGQSGSLTLAAVNAADPTYTNLQTSALSMTTGGRLRVDVEATDLDIGGVHAISVRDRELRRMQELALLDGMVNTIQALINSEPETSQRMGYEVR